MRVRPVLVIPIALAAAIAVGGAAAVSAAVGTAPRATTAGEASYAAPATVATTPTSASVQRGGGGHHDHGWGGGRSAGQAELLNELHRGQVPAEVASMLRAHASDYRWPGAAVGSTQASAMQLTSGVPVMEVGGFAGLYPAPTLQQFQHDVHEHQIHYFVTTTVGPPVPRDAAAMRISRWVEAHWAPTRLDGFSLYDVASPERDAGSGITPPV